MDQKFKKEWSSGPKSWQLEVGYIEVCCWHKIPPNERHLSPRMDSLSRSFSFCRFFLVLLCLFGDWKSSRLCDESQKSQYRQRKKREREREQKEQARFSSCDEDKKDRRTGLEESEREKRIERLGRLLGSIEVYCEKYCVLRWVGVYDGPSVTVNCVSCPVLFCPVV